MKKSALLSLTSSLVVGIMSLWLGIICPPNKHISGFLAVVAYSVFDVAAIVMSRTALRLADGIRGRFPNTTVRWFYVTQAWLIVKLVIRVIELDTVELVDVTVSDFMFYGISVSVFLSGAVTREFWHPPTEPVIDDSAPPVVKTATVEKLLALVLVEKSVLLVAMVFLIIAAISQAFIPHYIGQALDLVKEGNYALVLEALQGLVWAAVGYAFGSALRGSSFIILGARVNVRMREQLFRSIMGQEIGFFDTSKTGDLSSRMTQDIQKVCDQVQLNVNYFVRNCIALVVTVGFMTTLSWQLTLLSLVSVPVVVVVAQRYGNWMRDINKDVQDRLADCNSSSEEAFSAIHTVRSFGAEEWEVRKFVDLLKKVYQLSLRSARMYVPYMVVCITLPYGATALIILYGAKLAAAGILHPASLISIILYLEMLNGTISGMADIYASITAALGAAEKVMTILERQPAFPRDEHPLVPIESVSPSIEFKSVTFTYPSRQDVQVLGGISLVVPAGSVAALVGPSGHGKTTCLALLQRWYMQTAGEILVGGVPIRRFAHETYHQYVSCVNQEPLLFARSVRENILFGLINPGDDISLELETRLLEATRLANAHQFISQMPKGYDTEVGMRGVQLSGGQKQRIAIARALIRNPKILLLDEATSALDSESEKQVQEALDSMMRANKGATVVVVAHRLSTVRNADRIYLVKHGKVQESGKHDDLIKNTSSAYYQLVANQMMNNTEQVVLSN
jgi:ATP-binding cassette, subfamily B (MDR/TAP), member 9